jgi:type I restriction-modification system DNA methylase subunit
MTPITQADINKATWAACDTFRGVVDPSIYKDYVLTMLFLKYLSDVWKDHHARYTAEHPDAPDLVAALMAQLVDPQPGDDICDPTCGSASLLMKCARLIRDRHGSRHYALFGHEAIGSTWALARMNLVLHSEENHQVEWGDTIRNPKPRSPVQPTAAPHA